jgi:hypothetical protein
MEMMISHVVLCPVVMQCVRNMMTVTCAAAFCNISDIHMGVTVENSVLLFT